MNLKQLFTMVKSKEAKKVCFIDADKNSYIVTNLTQSKSGLILFKIIEFGTYQKISDDIREINKIIKAYKVV
jgi:hypothetical protein